MTAATLKTRTLKDLIGLAKRSGVVGWNQMRKEDLVHAILKNSKRKAAATLKNANGEKSRGLKSTSVKKSPVSKSASRNDRPRPVVAVAARNGKKHQPTNRIAAAPSPTPASVQQTKKITKKIDQVKSKLWANKNLAADTALDTETNSTSKPIALKSKWPTKDRLVVMVRGPFWLHATWDLTPAGVQRAQAALGQDWHAAKPILRLMTLSTHGSSTSSERVLRDISIHGGVKNWFIDVNNPPQSFRLEIGYLTSTGRFFCLARSNTVTTPPPQVGDSLDTHWGDIALDCEKIYALSGGNGEGANELTELFEEKLQRPVGMAVANSHSSLAAEGLIPRDKNFRMEVDAEIVLRGATLPGANVTIQGEPIKTHSDGTFSARMDFPNRRQVIPILACSKDGVQQRTVVLAIERNTKAMEPQLRESTTE